MAEESKRKPEPSESLNAQLRKLIYSALSRAAVSVGIHVDASQLHPESILTTDQVPNLVDTFISVGRQLGLLIASARNRQVVEIIDLVREGMPIIIVDGSDKCYLLRSATGRRVDVNVITADRVDLVTMSRREIDELLRHEHREVLIIKPQLECDSVSANPAKQHTGHGGHHDHLPPLRRFVGLLRMDRRDISSVTLFAFVAGLLSLASPLAVESLVNVVSWGVYLQPLFVLALILFVFLGLSAVLSVLQSVVVEIIQRRQFVRIVCDLAHRFPRANRQQLEAVYPRELANRLFDIMTIQKATATLLLEGISIVLMTGLGLVLLGFYHPFLLGFDLILVVCMTVITWFLGWGGINTSIRESRIKYRMAHWLQDIIDSPVAFRINGGESLAVNRTSKIATEYIDARKNHFRILLRQLMFANGLQALALTALLSLGGWLVIRGELTLGQLVASELVVATVVGAFSKAGKSIEQFYDLMAGTEKVGHLLDLLTDPAESITVSSDQALAVKWDDLRIEWGPQSIALPRSSVPAGGLLAIVTHDHPGLIMQCLAGLVEPRAGMVEVDGMDVQRLAVGYQQGQVVSLASQGEIFHGSVSDNVDLGRSCVGRARVREILQQVGLWDDIIRLDGGLETQLQTGGFPLSETQRAKLLIARATVARPRVLLIDGLLDLLPAEEQRRLIQFFRSSEAGWTTVIATRLDSVAQQCQQRIQVE